MIELGEQGIIGAQRQAAVVARRDAPFTADIDAVLGRPHQASVREICRGRRRRTRGIGEIGVIFGVEIRSEEHTSELQSLMRISYAVFCLKKKKYNRNTRDKER